MSNIATTNGCPYRVFMANMVSSDSSRARRLRRPVREFPGAPFYALSDNRDKKIFVYLVSPSEKAKQYFRAIAAIPVGESTQIPVSLADE